MTVYHLCRIKRLRDISDTMWTQTRTPLSKKLDSGNTLYQEKPSLSHSHYTNLDTVSPKMSSTLIFISNSSSSCWEHLFSSTHCFDRTDLLLDLHESKVTPAHSLGVKWIDMHELCAIALKTSIHPQVFAASSHSLGMQERLDVEFDAKRSNIRACTEHLMGKREGI